MKKPFVIHPVLLGIYPVLFLFAYNIKNFSLNVIYIPMAVILCFVMLIWSGLGFIFKDQKKAGLLVSLFLIVFFSYGYTYAVVSKISFIVWHIGSNKFLCLIWGGVFLSGSYFIIKARGDLVKITNLLNVVAISLAGISLLNIGIYKYKEALTPGQVKNMADIDINSAISENPSRLPNIYYIILDGYVREDLFKEVFDADNSALPNFLTRKGFYVAHKSTSNYIFTRFSLCSSLNMNYMNTLFGQPDDTVFSESAVINLIKNSFVIRFLKRHGYTIATFATGYSPTEIEGADIYLSGGLPLNEFQLGLLRTTPIPNMPKLFFDLYTQHRKNILFPFDKLKDMSDIKVPFFVFAHILAPHPPFVFGPNGEEITPDRPYTMEDKDFLKLDGADKNEYKEGYKKQILFISKKTMETITSIFSRKSERPVIIIIQADHGSAYRFVTKSYKEHDEALRERTAILNAYYFSDKDYTKLYDTVTPVNTFRIIFNQYFHTNFEILGDYVSKAYKFN